MYDTCRRCINDKDESMASDTLFAAAPEGTTWPLDLDAVEAEFRRRFPDAVISRERTLVSGRNYISADVPIEGMMLPASYFENGNLALSDGTPELWADTFAWFLSLLPAGTPIVALTDQNQNLTPIPESATSAQIQQIYERLIAEA